MEPKSSSNLSVSKLYINGKNIYLRMLWEDNGIDLFCLKVFDGTNSWSGRFSSEFAESCRECVDETEDEYKTNIRQGLSGNQTAKFIYDFAVSPENKNCAKFSWKKVFDDSTVMTHGFVPLHLDDANVSKDTLIDFLLNENKELREEVDNYNRRNEALSENLDQYKRELEDFVNSKTSLESNLYGKFIQLLNEKKRRIRLLEENLQKLS